MVSVRFNLIEPVVSMMSLSVLNRLQAETVTELDAPLPAILNKAFKGEL
jgi:hypothetical protein